MPRIVEREEYDDVHGKKEKKFTVEEIYSSPASRIIFGAKESGKTILLDKILIDLTENISKCHKIPVYFNFEDLRNNNYRAILSKFLNINIKEVEVFLSKNTIVLLIDNLSFDKKNYYKINALEHFLKDHSVQVIATCTQTIEDMIPAELYEYKTVANFSRLTIKSFRIKEIKSLAKAWFSKNEVFHASEQVENLIKNLGKLNLPRTPLAISIFLWVFEQKEGGCRPINHATMLETFIGLLLEKRSMQEMYSDSFDYKNKERLLADLASEMLKQGEKNYRMPYIEVVNFIDEIFKIKKFELFDSHDNILKSFTSASILVKELDEGGIFIRFRFPCFFQYFIMKKMEFSSAFREMVLAEDNFLFYIDEIDYYTGLKRDRIDILNILVERMNLAHKDIVKKTMVPQYSFENIIKDEASLVGFLDEKFFDEVNNKPDLAKPSIDEIGDFFLEARGKQGIIKHKEKEFGPTEKLRMILSITAKVLKNTEETGDNREKDTRIKEEAYKSILTCLMANAKLEIYHTEKSIREELGKLEGEIKGELEDKSKELVLLQKKMSPLIFGAILSNLVGTKKQSIFYREKIINDFNNKEVSDFEKFLSVFLYASVDGDDYITYIERFINQVNCNYIIDATFFMVMSLYCTKSKTPQTDKEYENLLVTLKLNLPKLRKRGAATFVKVRAKDQFLKGIRKMREQWKANEDV